MENLTWYSVDQLNEPMNLLLNATNKLKFVNEFYDTSSIIGDPPTPVKNNSKNNQELFIETDSNFHSTNSLKEEIFTPCKDEIFELVEEGDNKELRTLRKDCESNPDSFLNCEIHVTIK